jgi:hypothetical protein
MTEDPLQALFERAKRAPRDPVTNPPPGFVDKILRRRRSQVRENQIAFQASLVSIVTALCIFATIFGLNYDSVISATADDQDPVVEMANSLWDSAGN